VRYIARAVSTDRRTHGAPSLTAIWLACLRSTRRARCCCCGFCDWLFQLVCAHCCRRRHATRRRVIVEISISRHLR